MDLLKGIPKELLDRLPDFLIKPNPYIFMSNKFVVFDLETNTKGDGRSPLACWPENNAVCASWCVGKDGPAHNLYGNQLEFGELVDALEEADFIVAYNGKFDLGYMKRAGIDLHKLVMYDPMIAEYVLNGNLPKPLSLDHVAKTYGLEGKDDYINILMKGGVDPEDMPKSLLIERCDSDIVQTREVFLRQRDKMERKNLFGLIYTRCILSMPLCDIESNGMCLDEDAVHDLYVERSVGLAEAVAEMDAFTGGINPRSVPQVREFIYDVLKFKPKMKGKGKNATPEYSTKTDDLLALNATTKRQREYLVLKKKWSGFNADVTKNLLFFNSICTDKKRPGNLFYANFNQCRTKTHRLSSSGIKRTFEHVLNDKGKPITKSVQFQNFKREFKCVMKARHDGWLMGEGDGSQLEFRVAGFMGQCKVATQEIVDGVDVHVQSASIINKVPKEKVTKDMRTAAKADTFKPLFGGQMGTEGQMAYYQWFAEHYAGVADVQQKWIDQALCKKRIILPHGMIFYFPYCSMNKGGYVSDSTNIKNYPIQSFATAEIIPIAVTYLWHMMREMESFLVNTVHDSAIAELHPDEKAEFTELCRYAFCDLVYHYLKEVYDIEFNVPLGVGVKIGKNWGKGDEVVCAPMPPFKMKGVDYTNLQTDWQAG